MASHKQQRKQKKQQQAVATRNSQKAAAERKGVPPTEPKPLSRNGRRKAAARARANSLQQQEETKIPAIQDPMKQPASEPMDLEMKQELNVPIAQNDEVQNVIEPVEQRANSLQQQEETKIPAIQDPMKQPASEPMDLEMKQELNVPIAQNDKVVAAVAPAAEPSAKGGEMPSPHPLLVRAVGATRPMAAFVHSHPALTTAAGVGVGLCVLPLVLLTSPMILSTAATYKLLCPTRVKDTLHHYSAKLAEEIRRAAQTV